MSVAGVHGQQVHGVAEFGMQAFEERDTARDAAGAFEVEGHDEAGPRPVLWWGEGVAVDEVGGGGPIHAGSVLDWRGGPMLGA
ncbi:hypothetical protein GCM10008937_03630 [Deinococcus depolymerans]|uniref:Uncharacterized protein n=1 Tax=Deinococcus depolymerans TaxID=392408 RepID=A0ABN1BKN9_9DEIO